MSNSSHSKADTTTMRTRESGSANMNDIRSYLSKKRKAKQSQPGLSDFEDDCIAFASNKAVPGPSTVVNSASVKPLEKPLAEANVLQAQNKRIRLFSHVEIPAAPSSFSCRPSPVKTKQVRTSMAEQNDPDKMYGSDEGPLPGLAGDDDNVGLSCKNSGKGNSAWRAFASASGFSIHDDSAASTRRPRKAAIRRSYAPDELSDNFADELADSEDELAKGHSNVARKRKPAAKSRQEDSDFEEDFHVNAASEDDDFDEDASDELTSEAASEPEPELFEGARPVKKSKSASNRPSSSKTAPAEKASGEDMKRLLNRPKGVVKGLDHSLPPLHEIDEIFVDMTERALKMGLGRATTHLKARPLRVATMCSGTESPILAMQMVSDSLQKLGHDSFDVEHVFSAEIVPFKQAYIERNFAPPKIFRNIVEFIDAFEGNATQNDGPVATTAYGAKVSIPLDVDVVIAGTSCVDYSALNNKKKGITDDGESGLTWHGALAYCKEARPAIIIFENVVGADWGNMLKHYRDIGYDCGGVLVDSKDFYIPQTRQRGYMVCFDTSKEQAKMKTGSLSKTWQGLMKDFRRLSSSPISSFLIPNDQVVRRLQGRDDDAVREVDWSKCEITQMKYRSDEKLGSARPFTQWTESGTMSVPDNSSPAWYRRQVERVLDTIDCSILRKGREGYDARYKTRIWDLSQNIYRSTDRQPFGVTGCITPDGIPFISDAGRAMSAEETLKLQGIPLNRISFTTETSNDQQDLAGNAMTSTVVGSAMLAALITGYRLISTLASGTGASNNTLCVEEASFLNGSLLEKTMDKSCSRDFAVDTILKSARKAMRKCYCEGGSGIVNKPLQICLECGHTTHVLCGGNPQHNYVPLRHDRERPEDFVETLKAVLPLHLSFLSADCGDFDALVAATEREDRGNEYMEAVQRAINHNFSLSYLRRTHCWTASYVSQHARLDLAIRDCQCNWHLYGIAASNLASNDWLRAQLQQPLATATIKDTLFNVEWIWRYPGRRQMPITIQGEKGDMVPTWWARSGMPEYRGDKQPEKLEISGARTLLQTSVEGTYRLLPRCGKACDSLYRRDAPNSDGNPLWLFLDPSRTGDPDKDEFVFSYNKELLEYNEVRPIIAKIKAPWRPWPTLGRHSPLATTLVVDAVWGPAFPNMRLEARTKRVELSTSPQSTGLLGIECTTASLLIQCEVESSDLLLKPSDKGSNRALDAQFLLDNAWTLEIFRRNLQAQGWQVIKLASQNCASCAPARPQLRWRLAKGVLHSYEDSAGAAEYERAVKSRPAPFVLQVGESRSSKNLLRFGVNAASLAHLALARLPTALRAQAEVKWRLDTTDANASLSQYPKFRLHNTKGLMPYSGPLEMSVELFPKQRLSLAWMRAQEEGVNFGLEEIEEARLTVHGWRAEARASVPATIRGGICADHPGFGKTITSLALIQAQFLSSSLAAMRKDLQTRSAGLLASSATLIICPGTLLKQWMEEIEDKLQYREGVIAIDRVSDLAKFTVNHFETARIIIANRSIFEKDEYAERLAVFVGMPGLATKSGRAFAHWLGHAHTQVPEHVQKMQHTSSQEFKNHVSKKYQDRMQSDEFKAAVPSRRLRGQNVGNSKSSNTTSTCTKPASTVLDTKGIRTPLFEMFYFNRLIVDEFHNYEPREYATILALRSDKRWGLSATPAIDDFYDISRMAALIGVSLQYGCDAKGIMKAKNRRTLQTEMTAFEIFDSMRQMPSRATHDRIWELDQAFLDAFVRRNVMDYGEMTYDDYIVPVSLDLAHRTLYFELSQQLNSLDMRLKKGRKKEATRRDNRIQKAMAFAETAEDALTSTAAFYKHYFAEQDPVDALRTDCTLEESQLKQKLSSLLLEAAIKETDALTSWIETRLDSATLGDAETIQDVRSLISTLPKDAKTRLAKAAKKRKAPQGNKSKEEGSNKNAVVTELNAVAKGLLTATRSLRYIRHVQDVQNASTICYESICQHADCKKGDTEVAVSAFCGHCICRTCYNQLQQHHSYHCPDPGCGVDMHPYHLLWRSKMGDLHRTEYAPYGAKIEVAMDLLQEIDKRGDQAILFVQYAQQLEEVSQALEDRDIPATVVKDTKTAGSQIAEFRTSKDSTVIVLNASDETAAGSNLQNANHVLFLSPLLRDTQYAYEATMAQAVGRVRRHGQKKKIFVYRFVALDTIDVDILEHREKRVDALVERGAPEIRAPQSLANSDEAKPERTQLVKEDGRFSLRPQFWLVTSGQNSDDAAKVKGKSRVSGWEDFSSLVKFSRAYTEDDD
ncbi:hypothetical protein EJ03DRAFT_324490 [Teratosphaeria nubilosa]|uniref:Helicase C-terminal domain-containing protein n=1 Tax=Teratosphaeria nubilosa TaxID=161662 RepID=A0A6G1LHP0_9PEZI|nr:hypothetical protein EJ03DRAFT_324490 [Teratosphaeria nubilosa]